MTQKKGMSAAGEQTVYLPEDEYFYTGVAEEAEQVMRLFMASMQLRSVSCVSWGRSLAWRLHCR